MRKLFQRVIAVMLCLALLNDVDLWAFVQAQGTIDGVQTVSQNLSVSGDDAAASDELCGQDMLVTVNHYLNEVADDNMIFAPKLYADVDSGDSINNVIRESTGFAAESVTVYEAEEGIKSSEGVVVTDKLVNNALEIVAEGPELIIDVVYKETVGTLENEVTIFDYDSYGVNNKNSINYTGNYPSDVPFNQRMGTKTAQNDYVTLWDQSNGTGAGAVTRKLNINAFDHYDYNYAYVLEDEDSSNDNLWKDYKTSYPILEGLLLGLDGENYSNVNFRFADPGFFANDGRVGKTVVKGYEFVFNRTGSSYELASVINEERGSELTNLKEFFPLPNNGNRKNDYFGVRYDFSFRLGDYVGDIIYGFVGDDDLWVCLDGEVILDLGGIHGAYPDDFGRYKQVTYAPGEVDVWTKILGKETYTLQDKIDFVNQPENANKEYRVTVLFMERGSSKSNCHMRFVIPNVVSAPPVVTTTASFPMVKVDGDSKAPLSGVEFTLSSADGSYVGSGTTDENGYLTFWELNTGTYYLSETKPQSGYINAGPWVVTVSQTQSGNTITPYVSKATLASDVTVELVKENGYYVVENTLTESLIDYHKSAQLLDDADRTYTIKLDASVLDDASIKGVSFEDVQVIDYVDLRFEITEESKKVLEASGATISEEKGMEVVTWSGITLTTTPWNGEIIVKAKNDFLGGDEVPTNGPESKIVINGTDIQLPIPQVDVRLLELNIVGGETTIFLGEEITPMMYWREEVEDTLEAAYVDSKGQCVTLKLPALSDEACVELFEKGECTVPYSYGDISFGNLVYKVEGAPLEEHEAKAVGEPYETYIFTVTYEAFNRTDDVDTLFGTESTECEYDVNVVAGVLKISKTIYASDYKATQGDPIFSFKVMKDGKLYAYRTVRFTDMSVYNLETAEGTVTLEAPILEGLEKGVYTVEELKSIRFACTDVEATGSAVLSSDVSKRNAVFEIGYDSEGVASKVEGLVRFTNDKEYEKNFSDTDVVVNHCEFDEYGNLIWIDDDLMGAQE